nr:hypothetical protein [Tanacetum cinerariifolium]
MNSSLVAPNLTSICSSTRANTDAKSKSIDGGLVALVVGGGVDVNCCSRGVKDDSEHETDESESGSKSNHEENKEDDKEEVKDEFVKTSSNDSDDEDETKIPNKAEGDEDEEIDYTTSQLYDDADIRLNELVDNDKG